MSEEPFPDNWILAEIRSPDGERVGYFRKLNEAPPPEGRHEWRAWLTLHFDPKPNRMPDSSDLEVFKEVEDGIAARLEEKGMADLVAVFTLEGKRDHLLYFSDRDLVLNELAALLRPHTRFRPDVEVRHDPEWAEFRDLMG